MANTRQSIIVTGATGKQGGAFIQALLEKPSQPFNIFAVTRNKNSRAAKELANKPHVEVIEGDFDNPEELFSQVRQPSGLFAVTTPALGKKNAAGIEEQQGKAMIDAALQAGVKHIVYTSVDRGVGSDDKETPVPHFRSKKHVEDHLKSKGRDAGLTWTIIRPVAFMDNLSDDFIGKIFMAAWRQNGSDAKLQLIGSRDIGRVAAEAMIHASRDDYKNRSIALAGDELSPQEAAVVFQRATGKSIPCTYGIFATMSKWVMDDELGKMFRWFKDDGYAADVSALRRRYPFLKTFEEWVVQESAWRKT